MTGANTSAASSGASNQWASLSFVEVLEDLSSRFIVNLPSEELQRIERICFQVEQAHWFYEDFLRPLNPKLPSLNLRKFSIYILQTASLSVPLIRQYVSSNNDANSSGTIQDLSALGGQTYGLEAAFDEFMKYKTRVPVCGAVLLSEDFKSCVLVKGWRSSAAWGFPKGKINQSESHRDCAVRETLEETGFDCSELLAPESPHWMELNVREQKMRLYIVPGVRKDTVFETQTRKEISKISWFKLSDLPTWKQSQAGGGGGLASANAGAKFYLVTPFIGKLKQWIRDNKKRVQIEQGGIPGADLEQSSAMASTESTAMRVAPAQPLAEQATTAPSSLSQSNGDSATLLALLQGSNARPAPPPAQSLGTFNPHAHQSVVPPVLASGPAASAASSRTTHYPQPSDPEQILAQQLQNQHLSAPSSQSPLPAPRAAKSSGGTLKLLEMLSPNAPAAQPAALASENPAPGQDLGEEHERARKREALLLQLMGGDIEPSSQQGAKASGTHQHNSPDGFGQFAERPNTAIPKTAKEASLLAMLQNGDGFLEQAPQQWQQQQHEATHVVGPPAPPLNVMHDQRDQHQATGTYPQGGANGPYLSPPPPPHAVAGIHSPDVGRASLLAMLNAGPVTSSRGAPQNLQQQAHMYPQPVPYPHHLPSMPLSGPPPPHIQHSGFPPWQQYPQHPHGPQSAQPGFPPGPMPPMAHMPPMAGPPFSSQHHSQGQFHQQPHNDGRGLGLPEVQNGGGGQFGPPLPFSPPMQQNVGVPNGPAGGPAPPKQNGNTGGLLALLNGP
ncbi:DCP2-domain-containing protein [Microstroma glucosiphilum]|uniref:DCP2-domain-containing protein n=1 Tax=Pseudomicrostroma glucosiphilum TaxID=1684307 RepID=A0A316UFS5_9BASI|nr:DCP2-domain-containing protein [Pseudomicrostroma glucosiphilum]PWN24080.1 DCP2-domain-containing protein [Pseudomicrostroma glucosiphilum]